MNHVKVIKAVADTRPGTVLAVVQHRRYWGGTGNSFENGWVSDGRGIGTFEVGMTTSPYTHYCVTEAMLQRFPDCFEAVQESDLRRLESS